MPFLPNQAAESCLERAWRLLDLADEKLPIKVAKNDLRRMSLVMAVAAIDSYMHGIILRRIADVRRRTHLPSELRRLEIAFCDLAHLADTSIEARRQGHDTRPWVQVKAVLQARLLKETFQSYDQVARAFKIAGVEDGWSKIASELGEKEVKIKDRLDALVHRRNQIVHEGDLKRASRPRRRQFNSTDPDEVREDVDWVGSLIEAMENVVNNHT
jgi:hypothetical protein